ncbi:serine hydrolase domain-containing protein [Sphingobacterium tabacisoli]|uniref:Serine hydrolase domain-containing protein n=1 Tax=Sphingobacterium tabacisoli TaxID=2044855 RepID=A0ABW5L892_9SPHI|nr:serine hydrolase domain-containing protein [Sphingobacterium tabacisoli]
MKYLLSIHVLFILLISCAAAQKRDNARKDDALTKSLEIAYERKAIKGFSVSIVNENGPVYSNGFGFADLDQNKPYDSNSIQNIASISKTLIGIALLKAQELGKLNINDPINIYLPFEVINPQYPEAPILIKHLAYHTSSITDPDEVYAKSYVLSKDAHREDEGVYDYFNTSDTYISLQDFIGNCLSEKGKWYTKNMFINARPGETREYSNIAAALCALVIEHAVGEDYRTFTKQHILIPLKMGNSGWTSTDIDSTKRSRLFVNNEKMIAEYSLITYADGGFITSSNDLGLFLSELINGYRGTGKLLSPDSYKKLFEKKRFIDNGKVEDYGVFIEFRDGFLKVKNDMIGHNGSDPGVFTAMYFNPTTHVGKILLVNTDTDFREDVWPEIEEIWKSLSDYKIML